MVEDSGWGLGSSRNNDLMNLEGILGLRETLAQCPAHV